VFGLLCPEYQIKTLPLEIEIMLKVKEKRGEKKK
jgi:hypothetical protein